MIDLEEHLERAWMQGCSCTWTLTSLPAGGHTWLRTATHERCPYHGSRGEV